MYVASSLLYIDTQFKVTTSFTYRSGGWVPFKLDFEIFAFGIIFFSVN